MKTKPIIFDAQSVQAILDGRKSQTRRAVKPQPEHQLRQKDNGMWHEYDDSLTYPWGYQIAPRYSPGDVLWVREAWTFRFFRYPPCKNKEAKWACHDCYRLKDNDRTLMDSHPYTYIYRASPETYGEHDVATWRSPIHMPRTAARLLLRVTDVRCERLCDISVEDCFAEGVPKVNPFSVEYYFKPHWNSINAKRGYPWESNPHCWVIAFERIQEDVTHA